MRIERIGNAVLYNGDCLEVMAGLEPVSHVISDPPYEERFHQAKNGLDRRLRNDRGPDLRTLNFESINAIRSRVVEAAAAICEGWFIAFCNIEGVAPWEDAIRSSTIKYKRACVWVKPDATPQLNGQGPAMGAECFVAAWAGRGVAKWNSGGKRGVYTHNTNSRDRDGRHPTEKPVPLMLELLADFTNPGQTVLDPFMGSGTTGVACIRAGRKFIGIERDPAYFEIACERVAKATAQPDLLISAAAPRARTPLLFGDNDNLRSRKSA